MNRPPEEILSEAFAEAHLGQLDRDIALFMQLCIDDGMDPITLQQYMVPVRQLMRVASTGQRRRNVRLTA